MANPLRLRLRRFLYLDEDLTNEFLAQVEGGLYGEEAQSTTAVREGGGGLRAQVGPMGGEVSRARSSEETTTRTVQPKAEGQFARLAAHLEREQAVQYLEAFDEGIWEQLRRGEAVEVESQLETPAILRLAGAVEGFEAFGQVMEGIEMIGAFRGMLSGMPVFAGPVGAPGYCFISPLKREWLRVSLEELEGEATLSATIERTLGPGETWSLLDVMGLGGLPRSARRSVEREMKTMKDFGGNVVRPPAALVAPIAIFR